MPRPYEPVSVEDRTRLLELDTAQEGVARRLLRVQLEAIDLLMVGRRLKGEEELLYRKIAAERGIPDSATIEVNPKDGQIEVSTGNTPGPVADSALEPRESEAEPRADVTSD